MNRVNSPSKFLLNIVNLDQQYCIGFGSQQLTEIGKKTTGLKDLKEKKIKSFVVTGKKGVLKENTNGKYVRKQPERKTSVWKHIEYYSHRFERDIIFDRQFSIWEKEILHKYELELKVAFTPQGELIFHFPFIKMEDSNSHYLKAGVAMNMSIQLGGYYMLYDKKFEPIIPVTKIKDKSILPPGNYGSVKEKLETILSNLNAENDLVDLKGSSYRFALLKEHKPSEVTMGIGGFNEYLMFEYDNLDLIILENLKSGNATFLFTLSKFDKEKELNKQNAKADESFIARIIHNNMGDWNKKMRKYFKM